MEFNQTIHTKKFLLENLNTLSSLCLNSSGFALSALAQDDELLRIILNNFGDTVAHTLAANQREWLSTGKASNLEILQLRNNLDHTVAHQAVNHPECLKLDAIFSKPILTIHLKEYLEETNELIVDEILAERIAKKYCMSHGFDESVMILKLIEQGAAYKHSKPLSIEIGNKVMARVGELLAEIIEPSIKLKVCLALYSTGHHALLRCKESPTKGSLADWMRFLEQSEQVIHQQISMNQNLLDEEYVADFFCQHGDDLWKKLQSQKNFMSLSDIELTPQEFDDTPTTKLY